MTYELTHSTDVVQDYKRILEQYPILSFEEEQELAKRFKLQKDLKAAEKLIFSNLRLVLKVANKFKGYGLPFSDLVQEGTIGLMKAVKTFDYTKGVRLVTWAFNYVRAEIVEFIHNNFKMVKIATTHEHKKLFFNREIANSDRTTAEIAEELNVSEKDVLEFEQRYAVVQVHLERDTIDEPHYTIPDTSLEPTNVIERIQKDWLLSKGIQNALNKLDERTRSIIQSRWLDDNPKTLHELAEVHGVSHERIRQVEQAGLKKLKELL